MKAGRLPQLLLGPISVTGEMTVVYISKWPASVPGISHILKSGSINFLSKTI